MIRTGANVRIQRQYLLWVLLGYVVGLIPIAMQTWRSMAAFTFGEVLLAVLAFTYRSTRADVRADDVGLWMRGKLLVATRAVQSIQIRERRGRTYLFMRRVWMPGVEIAVADDADARALAAAMRLDPNGVVARYPMQQVGRATELASRFAFHMQWVVLLFTVAYLASGRTGDTVLFGAFLVMNGLHWIVAVRRNERVEIGAARANW